MGRIKTWSELTPEEQRERKRWWFLYFNDYDFWRAQEQKWQATGIVPGINHDETRVGRSRRYRENTYAAMNRLHSRCQSHQPPARLGATILRYNERQCSSD